MTALLILAVALWDRPGFDALTLPKADRHELREVLQKWEEATAHTNGLKVTFAQYRYSDVHRIETRGAGTLIYIAPHSGSYEIEPIRVDRLQAQRDGWRLEPARTDRWHWDKSEVQCRLGDGPMETYVLPLVEARKLWPGTFRQWIETPGGFLRPFLANFSGNSMRWRYQMRIANRNKREIRVEFTPWVQRDIQRLECILDAQSYRPTAIRIVESGQGVSTTYDVKQIQVR